MLVDLEEHTYGEAAAILAVPIGTVVDVFADTPDLELARKLVTIAGRGCQVVNTLREAAPIAITYAGSPVEVGDRSFVGPRALSRSVAPGTTSRPGLGSPPPGQFVAWSPTVFTVRRRVATGSDHDFPRDISTRHCVAERELGRRGIATVCLAHDGTRTRPLMPATSHTASQ